MHGGHKNQLLCLLYKRQNKKTSVEKLFEFFKKVVAGQFGYEKKNLSSSKLDSIAKKRCQSTPFFMLGFKFCK